MPVVLLGNPAALDNGQPIGEQVTVAVIPEADSHSEAMRTITHDDGGWVRCAAEPATWVASESDRLAAALADHFECPVISMEKAREHLANAHVRAGEKR